MNVSLKNFKEEERKFIVPTMFKSLFLTKRQRGFSFCWNVTQR
jgi:hypothetical protein